MSNLGFQVVNMFKGFLGNTFYLLQQNILCLKFFGYRKFVVELSQSGTYGHRSFITESLIRIHIINVTESV